MLVHQCGSTCAQWPEWMDGLKKKVLSVHKPKQSCQSRTHDQLILDTQTEQPAGHGDADKTQNSHCDAKSWTSTSQTSQNPRNIMAVKPSVYMLFFFFFFVKQKGKGKKQFEENATLAVAQFVFVVDVEFPNIRLGFQIRSI